MKRILFYLLSGLAIMSCSNENDLSPATNTSTHQNSLAPSTEVFMAGKKVTSYTSRTTLSSFDEVGAYENVYFYIRIDSRIPNIVGTQNSSLYFPQNRNSQTIYTTSNKGKVKDTNSFNYNYLGSRGVNEYVFDPKGVATNKAILQMPTLNDLLAVNETNLGESLRNVDRNNMKIIWYVVKNQPGDRLPNGTSGAWHVDGVLTTLSTTDVTQIPGMNISEASYMIPTPPPAPAAIEGQVKVDIHQQEHQNWEAVKTTIHIGATVDEVRVSIPIARGDIAEKDDFAIRTYDAEYTINAEANIYKQVIASEYKNDANRSVVGLSDFVGTKSAADQAALNAAQGEVFLVQKGTGIERLFYVVNKNLYEYNYQLATWQPSSNFNIKVRVEHLDDKVVIVVKDISPYVIEAQKLVNPDGLTVEVWSYPRLALPTENKTEYRQSVYEKLKLSTVSVGYDQPNYSPNISTPAANGQQYTKVSSAYFH